MNEAWKTVFHKGLVPHLSDAGLEAIRKALAEDDPRLLQAATTSPPPLQCVQDFPCEGACLIGYAGWKGEGLTTVGEVEAYFGRMCYAVDCEVEEPAAVRWILNEFDDRDRATVLREFLPEVERAIASRLSAQAPQEKG